MTQNVYLGALFIGLGIIFVLGIWVPKFRFHWGRTPLICGPVSCAGMALFFGIAGFILATLHAVAFAPYRACFILLAIAGWNLAAFGAILDRRSYWNKSPQHKPISAERKARGLQGFAPKAGLVFGILFFLFILVLCLFNGTSLQK